MEGPTRFGDYLLFKKLSEDALGETYRAGLLAGRAVERIVLLRVYDGSGLDPQSLIDGMERHRQYVHGGAAPGATGGFRGPGLTFPLASGEIQGVPYSAYEYASGRDLASFAERANSSFSSLSLSHAVLIAERMAKGLAVVHQAEVGAAQAFHGFLVPQLVQVTSEGETRLTGFEVGNVLAAMVATGQLSGDLRRYLAPEVANGTDNPSSRGDIYSLGAILWELLTGTPLRPDASLALDTHLSTGRLIEGGELPAGLGNLLRQSLATAEHRISRADVWHRQLVSWMAEAGLGVSNFDLAFFVNELYREELKKDEVEVAAASDYEVKRRAPRPAPMVSAGDATGARMRSDAVTASRRSPWGLWIGLAALLLLAVALGVLLARRQAPARTLAAVGERPASVGTDPIAPPVAFDLDAATAELDRLMGERTAAVGARLADDYDAQIRSLQEQLDEAREVEQELTRESQRPTSPVPPPVVTSRVDPTLRAPSEGSPTAASATATTPGAGPPRASSPSPPAVAEETVPPELIALPNPVYPTEARRLGRQAVVLVKVLIDEKGRVHLAEPVSSERVGHGFDAAALRAAEAASYRPGTVGGQPRAMWTTLVVRFEL